MWEKRSNWELGTRVPLIIRVPWIPPSMGKRSRALVELVDVYKTVCDIVGLPLPDDTVPIDGVSLQPIFRDPTASVKDVALSTFPRCSHLGMPVYGARGAGGADNTCLEVERTDFTWMGYTMRTDRYRYDVSVPLIQWLRVIKLQKTSCLLILNSGTSAKDIHLYACIVVQVHGMGGLERHDTLAYLDADQGERALRPQG